jgi:tetratricopeptide (TPR) repeat protein
MKALFRLPLLLIVISCVQQATDSDQIIIPEMSLDYYRNSVISLEEKIKEEPQDIRFIKLQLNYYDKLGWPASSQGAIKRAEQFLSNDPVFINQKIEYLRSNDQNKELVDLISFQEAVGEVPTNMKKELVDALIAMDQSAEAVEVLQRFTEAEVEPLFMATRFFKATDSTLSRQWFDLFYSEGGMDESLISMYVPLLIADNNQSRAIEILETYLKDNMQNDANRTLAKLYYEVGDTVLAKSRLYQTGEKTDLFLLSNWFTNEKKYDSAHYVLSRITMVEPDNRRAILTRANIDQQRGWLSRSLTFYNQLIALDSTDQEAMEQIDLVNRKLSYLQKIREADKEIPILDLNSKRINN